MMTGRISKKQEEILEYLKEQILTKGYPPAVSEICEAVNLRSTSSVHAHLETLEKLGYIRRDPTKPRAIEITDESFSMVRRELVNIPIVGQVAAGTPILAEQNIDGYFPLPAEMVPSSGELYMLNVKGDSMINAGILNGDRLIVQHTESARNGEIVVALLDDSATVKRFYKEKGHVRLQPDNDNMEPIIVEQVSVIGKVVGLLRTHMQ